MDEIRNVWQKQEVEVMKMSVEELKAKAVKFEGTIRRRNLREQAACALVIVWFAVMFFRIPVTIPRIAFGLMIAGAIYVAWHIQAWGKGTPPPASEMGGNACVRYYRRELERQRDLLNSVWKWYLAPLIPGLALFVTWCVFIAPPDRRWFPVTFAVVCVATFWGIGALNHRVARQLDRQIQELEQ